MLAHGGMRRKDGERKRISINCLLVRVAAGRAEPASCTPAMQLPREQQQEPKKQ